jgi:pyruvate kinase
MRRTKIVCTLGPSSQSAATIRAMIRAGMDVARLNTSHGDIEDHNRFFHTVRSVAQEEGRHIAILMDLGGPKLRTGPTPDGQPLFFEAGSLVSLVGERVTGSLTRIGVDYPALSADVRAGERVLLDDGNLELAVERVAGDSLECRVILGGPLGPSKGVNFPYSGITLSAVTPRDRQMIAAGVELGVDYFALSFVGTADDIVVARTLINSLGADTPIIAKIERRQAIENLEAIVGEADGVMVARGDLGVELPPEDVPVQQRRIISAAGQEMIPVITATQMLESMVDAPRPTRAESSDVANAAWDLSDALMLSGETAAGRYPVEAVAMMDRIIRKAEESAPDETDPSLHPRTDDHSYVVALAARQIVHSDENMRGVVCFTRSGYTAFLLSKVHPSAPIYGVSPSESVCRRLALARGVIPVLAPLVNTSEEMLRIVDTVLVEKGHLAEGEEAVVVGSLPVRTAGTTNFLKLQRVGESRSY